MRVILSSLALSALLLAGCGGPHVRTTLSSASSATEPYRLGAGDEIRVAIVGLDSASNSYLVGAGGAVSLPLVGNVSVGGSTTEEAERTIADTLRAKDIVRRADVSVQVVKYRPFYILGEVQKPGEYPYSPGIDVMKAVALAGGYTFRADKRHPTITRADASGAARAFPNSLLKPGDTIIIPEAWF